MAESVIDIKAWLNELDDTDQVGVDDGGLCLRVVGYQQDAYYEIGGLPVPCENHMKATDANGFCAECGSDDPMPDHATKQPTIDGSGRSSGSARKFTGIALPLRVAEHQDERSDLRFTLIDFDGLTVIGTITEELAHFIRDACGPFEGFTKEDVTNDPDAWERDSEYTFDEWREEAGQGNTRLGYNEWVQHQRENAEDDTQPAALLPQDRPDWEPTFSAWRHGGWYVDNLRYPSGAVGCVSRNYPDAKWRIACDSRPFDEQPTFPNRIAAARGERDLIAQQQRDAGQVHEPVKD